MKDYVTTISDNGGVHINSGIPNHAFYVTALELGGFAWEKAGQIWYVTLKDRLDRKFQIPGLCKPDLSSGRRIIWRGGSRTAGCKERLGRGRLASRWHCAATTK